MIVGLASDSPELSLGNLADLLGDDLPAVVFSNGLITRMHDSLLIVLFRLGITVKLSEARELAWIAYFFFLCVIE
jgi:hypothetical protein